MKTYSMILTENYHQHYDLSALLSGKIDKYEFLTGEEILFLTGEEILPPDQISVI